MTFTPKEIREIKQNLKKNKWRGKKEAREYLQFITQKKDIKDLIKQVLNKGE